MRLGNQRTPSQPSNLTDEERVLRARLILEETFETVQKGLGLDIVLEPSSDANSAIQYSQIYVKIARPFDIIETVDGCCDISVVNTGTLVAVGIDDLPVLELVDDNNLAKFGPGSSIDQFGKIVKPPNHPPPDIAKNCVDKDTDLLTLIHLIILNYS